MAKAAISVCTDEEMRITSLCNDDMTGNTGWQRVYKSTLGLDSDDELFDNHGASLYCLVNGKAEKRSEEERRADWQEEPEPEPDKTEALQEQVDMLTECLLEMSEIIYGGD